jgi:site-specific DNA recombinase
MTTCAIYCRISRDRVGAGLGVERQEQDCRELAAKLGLTVAGVYTDNDLSAYSGKKRPEYLRMLADVEAGQIGVVLAWHTDRLHRSPTELENYIAICEQRGVPTHTVKAGPLDLATPSGRLVARQLGAVARYEVEHAVERQKRARQQAADAGRWSGGRRPYGYEPDGMTVRPDEARVVADATDATLLGVSLRTQCADLNTAGRATSTGRAWAPSELKKVLLRPRNAGLRQHRGNVIGKAVWPAIVLEEKWRAVVALLTAADRRTSPGSAHRWLLSGIARCGVCDAPVRVTMMAHIRASVPSYACSDGKCVVRNAAEVERLVEMVVVKRLQRRDAIGLLAPAAPGVDMAALNAEQENLQQRLDELADDLGIDERMMARRSQRLRERLDEIAEIKAVAGRGNVLAAVVNADDPAAAWASYDLSRKRTIIDMLMTIRILRAKKGRRPGWKPGQSYFDPSTVKIGWKAP